MNYRSLTFRLGAWYGLLLSATFSLVGTATFYGLQHYLQTNLHASLLRRLEQVEQIIRDAPAGTTADSIAQEIETRIAPENSNRFVRVTRLPATPIYRSGPPADRSFDPSLVPPAGGDRRLMINTATMAYLSGTYLVEVGVSTQSIQDVLQRLLDLLALLLPVLIACAAGGGYFLVSRALQPVDRISKMAEQISVQNLTLRIPVTPSGDALERLAISLNTMLGRLSDSVQTSRRFLADASHELRTPLTVIKCELQELTHEGDWTEGELRERVGSVLEEVARLEHLVIGLLALSRLEAREKQQEWVNVNLADLVASTAEQMRLLAEERGIEMDLSSLQDAMVLGDRARLNQIVVNLLDNAIRFTGRGGTVRLRTSMDDTATSLEVEDTGIGIPPAAIARVFDRFFRVDEARSREDGGGGLGLSIVKSICSLHDAKIEVHSEIGAGSCFRVRFPRRPLMDSNSLPASGADAAPGVPVRPAAPMDVVTRQIATARHRG
jgi:heavy metal sensor kinase